MRTARNRVRAACVAGLALWLTAGAPGAAGQHEHHGHHGHRMQVDEDGMVMNANTAILPRDCEAIAKEYLFEVQAGTEFAGGRPGTIFGYSESALRVEPCSLVTVSFSNRDEVRHQWMVHGLPRYLYPGGMFHLEANGGRTKSGSFIVPSDDATYLVHCDIAQHMEKGMKAQLQVGRGSGDLWSVPGLSGDVRRASYLPETSLAWALLAAVVGGVLALFAWRAVPGGR